MRLTLCEEPTRETRPDHNTGNYVPYLFLLSNVIFTWDLSISSCIAEDKELIMASRSPNEACILTVSLLSWDTFRA